VPVADTADIVHHLGGYGGGYLRRNLSEYVLLQLNAEVVHHFPVDMLNFVVGFTFVHAQHFGATLADVVSGKYNFDDSIWGSAQLRDNPAHIRDELVAVAFARKPLCAK